MKKIINKINILAFLILLILFIFTSLNIGKLSGEFSYIAFLKKQIHKVSRENQKLEEELLSLNLMVNVDNFIQNNNLVRVNKVKFFQILDSGIVAK